MARVSYQAHDQDREDQRAEERAEKRAMGREPLAGGPDPIHRFGGLNVTDEEFASVEAFIDYLVDDDRTEFTHFEVMCVNSRTGVQAPVIKALLESYGLAQKHRSFEKAVRGVTSNPNAGRFDGMHGGGGGSSIQHMAGSAG